jgi:electron transfer flavoprotein beta subunit
MNDDGTVNRSVLPAIFNPEDLNALELALEIKDRFTGTVTVLTMGPPQAAAVLREALHRGADRAILVTDAGCAASDTLATSYILSLAVRKTGFDIVLCGRQAIDGDTAQTGPQLAEKLGIPQITYVDRPVELDGRTITARRSIGNGWQLVRGALPVLLTVTDEANEPRVAAARKMMKYKKAAAPFEIEQRVKEQNPGADVETVKKLTAEMRARMEEKGLLIEQWDLAALGADLNWCGRSGSPTQVHRIQSVVLAARESRQVDPLQEAVSEMIHELIKDKTIA